MPYNIPVNFNKLITNKKFQFWSLFLVLILIRFFPFLLGKTLVFGDNYSLLVPGKIFTAGWLKEGIFPLWNPYLFSGIPWIGDITQSVFYPSTLLFVIFPAFLALNINIMLHLLIAYWGMYQLAKEWIKNHAWSLVAAVLWMFSTQMTGSINNLATLQSLAWFPLISYLGLRLTSKKVYQGWFALALLLQFLAGYPQHVLYSILLAVLLSAFKEYKQLALGKWFKSWLITAGLTIGLTAVAWLPLVDFLTRSTRVLQTSSQALVGSLHPVTMIKFFLPYFFDNPAHGIKWGPAWNGQPNVGIYLSWLGWLAVASSLAFKKIRTEVVFFATVTGLTLLFSLGQNLPGFTLIQQLFPLFRIARYPSMMMIISNTVLVLWAVRALQTWSLNKQLVKRFKWLISGVLVVSLGGLIVQQHWFNELWQMMANFASSSLSHSAFHTADRDRLILFEILRNIVFNSLFFLAAIYLFTTKTIKNRVFWFGLVLGIDLAFNTAGQFFYAPKKIYDTASENSAVVRQEIPVLETAFQYRVLTRNSNIPYTDYGSYWEALVVREPFSDSFVDATELKEFNHAQNLRDGQTPDWSMVFQLPTVNGYTTLLPQDYATLWNFSEEPRINFIDRVAPDNALLDDWAVKYYLVDDWFLIEEDLSEFSVIAEYDRWQVLERPEAKQRIRFKDDSPAIVTDFNENPNVLSFTVETETAERLIIADRYDRDLKATVNGEAVVVLNYQGMRELPLGAGVNEIKIWYYPQWLYLGLALSLISGIGMVIYLRR